MSRAGRLLRTGRGVRYVAHMSAQMTLPGLVPQWTLGDRLRKAREIAGLNQSEMSEQIGIARNSVANYEGGRYDPPRPVLIAWAFRTGVALDWLVKGDEGLPRVDSNHQPAGLRSDMMSVIYVMQSDDTRSGAPEEGALNTGVGNAAEATARSASDRRPRGAQTPTASPTRDELLAFRKTIRTGTRIEAL